MKKEPQPTPKAEEAPLDGNGQTIKGHVQYESHEGFATLAGGRGEETLVLAGNRRRGNDPLVRAAPEAWHELGKEAPPPRVRGRAA